jgi:hypothetical protein
VFGTSLRHQNRGGNAKQSDEGTVDTFVLVDAFAEMTDQSHTIVQLFPARTSVVMQPEIQSDLFYDYRTKMDSYPKWQAWMREKPPRLLVIWVSTICRSFSANRSAIGKTGQTLKFTFLMPASSPSIRLQMKSMHGWEVYGRLHSELRTRRAG